MAEELTAWQILQWASTIIIGIGVIISSAYVLKNFNKKTKIESSNFVFNLNKRFLEEPFKSISREIGEEIEGQGKFIISDNKKKYDLTNYLNELEIVSQFYLDGILTEEQTYEILGNQVLEAFSLKIIRKLIDDERKIGNQGDLFDNLQKVWKIMYEHQQKKLQGKDLESVETLFLNTIPKEETPKEENDSSKDKTQQDPEP